MKWIAYAFAVLIASVWQITCWTSWGPILFHAVSFPITLVVCLALEGGLYAVSLANGLDEEGRMNRRVGRALYPLAFVVPVFPFWEYVAPVLGGIFVFRLCRTGSLRYVVPATLGVGAIAAGLALTPWRHDLFAGGFVGWTAVLSGIFLLAYELWLLRRAHARASPSARAAE